MPSTLRVITMTVQTHAQLMTPRFHRPLVAIHCDPKVFPKHFTTDNRVRLVLVIHPRTRNTKVFRDCQLTDLQRILSSPETVYLGEIGLDWSEPNQTWGKLEALFRRLLSLSCAGQVLVHHLGGMIPRDIKVYTRGLEILWDY